MEKYFNVWVRLASINFSRLYSTSKIDSTFLVAGKLIRFFLFFLFLTSLLSDAKQVAGYSLQQIIIFYLTFNLIDITVQFFLRGVYEIRRYLTNGTVDLVLTQPINFFFRLASEWIDFLDFITLIPVAAILVFLAGSIEGVSITGIVMYILLILNAYLVAIGIHLVIFGISLISQETSGEIWIYRDLMTIGRFPIDIFPTTLRFAVTYLIPVGVMISFPAKALLGLLSPSLMITGMLIGALFFLGGLLFVQLCLRQYSSISS